MNYDQIKQNYPALASLLKRRRYTKREAEEMLKNWKELFDAPPIVQKENMEKIV